MLTVKEREKDDKRANVTREGGVRINESRQRRVAPPPSPPPAHYTRHQFSKVNRINKVFLIVIQSWIEKDHRAPRRVAFGAERDGVGLGSWAYLA